MSEYKREILIGNVPYLVICLGEPLKESIEVYPGDPKPVKEIFRDIKKTGYQHHIYRLGDHVFHPHGDAPKHQNQDLQDKGFESFNLDYVFNSAYLIDVSNSSDAEVSEGIKFLVKVKKEHIEQYSDLISKKGAIIIRTGYDKWLEANKKHDKNKIPHLTKEAGVFLAKFNNLKVIGIDSLTVDAIGKHDVHQKFKNKLIVESLIHLHSIPEENRTNFDLQTSTIAIQGATGGPITAFAFVKINNN